MENDSKNYARKTSCRYRFSVAPNNEAVLHWIANQFDLSASLCDIIIHAIEENGYQDVMAHQIDDIGRKPKRGRPQSDEPKRASKKVLAEPEPARVVQPKALPEQSFRAETEPKTEGIRTKDRLNDLLNS